jgi:hypothetical protein
VVQLGKSFCFNVWWLKGSCKKFYVRFICFIIGIVCLFSAACPSVIKELLYLSVVFGRCHERLGVGLEASIVLKSV